MTNYRIDPTTKTIHRDGESLDPWALTWSPAAAPKSAEPATARQAVRALFSGPALVRRVPVGVIGPRDASPEQLATAEALGRALAQTGLQMLCGGRDGVMQAVCKGNFEAGGQPMALLPGEHWTEANPYVTTPLATGIGPVRNALIARSCFALIAVGGGYGTTTEMAYGLHFDKPVLALAGAPRLDGAHYLDTVEQAVEMVCHYFLAQR